MSLHTSRRSQDERSINHRTLQSLLLFLLMTFSSCVAFSAQKNLGKPFALVELFTSEGCSSCPAADRFLSDQVQRASQGERIMALSFHVDYWDHLGWKDRFASSQFTERQKYYAKLFHSASVYTPMMVVNGQGHFVGSRRGTGNQRIQAALAQTPQAGLSLKLERHEQNLLIHYQTNAESKHSLCLALVERQLHSSILRGENAGKNPTHDNVVRVFRSLPLQESKGTTSIQLPIGLVQDHSSLIGFIQNIAKGNVLAAESLPL